MQKRRTGLFPMVRLVVASAVIGLLFGLLALGHLQRAEAATGINEQLNFQGRLLDSTGAVIADGNYNMQFKVYQGGDGVLGGGDETLKWTEARLNNNSQGVVVKNGYFSVNLGSVTAFGSNVDWNQDTLWLSVHIGGTAPTCTPFSTCAGAETEMSPFKRLTSTPYALNSKTLQGLAASAFAQLAATQVFTATNTFQPATDITGLIAKQNSNGAPTADIFDVKTQNASNVIQVTGPALNEAAVTISSIGGTRDLTLDSASGTLKLGSNTTTVQFTNAGADSIKSTSGQNLTLDTGGGTANVNVGTTNATTTTLGRSGGTTTITGGASSTISFTNFGVSSAGVITVQGAQTADLTTATAGTANGITVQPGISSAVNGTGAALALKAGDQSGTTCNSSNCAGGSITIQGGAATGASGTTRNGGNVTIDAGTGATANGNVNVGTTNSVTTTLGRSGGTTSINGGASSAISFTNFAASSAGVITIQGNQASDITTLSNNNLTINPAGSGALIATLDATTAITNGDLQINRSGTLTAADSTGDIIATRSVVTNSTGSLNDTANFVQLTSNITGTGTDTGSVLGVTQSNASASGATISISNSGSGVDILGTSSTWQVTKAGNATFNQVISPTHTGTGAVTLSSGGSSDLTLDSASNIIQIAATDTTLQRQAAGNYTIDLKNASATTKLLVTNSGASGAAVISAQTGYQINNASATSGHYLRGDGTNYVDSLIQTADLPTGSGNYIQNQNSGQQSSSNFWISGTGRADTSFTTPLLDTATAVALGIGTTNATAINLNQNTTIAATKTLTVTSGLTSLTANTSGDALNVSNSTSTGNIAVFKDNSTAVATIADGGAATFKNSTNSTAAFQIQNSGNTNVLAVDTTNLQNTATNLQASGTLSVANNGTSASLRAQLATSTVTASGNEITDVTRSKDKNTGGQGDGRAAPDSSYGIWEGTTNLLSNGGFTTNNTSWTGVGLSGGGNPTRDTTQAKFGNAAGKFVTANAAANEGAYQNFTATAAKYTISAWVKGASGTVRIAIRDNAGADNTIGSPVTMDGTWKRLTLISSANLTAATYRLYVETDVQQNITYYVDGAQAELAYYATPYVETDGGTAARSAPSLSTSSSVLTNTQGWVAVRLRLGITEPTHASDPFWRGIFDWGQSDSNSISIYTQPNSSNITLRRIATGGSGTNSLNVASASKSVGNFITVIGKWTSNSLALSLDGNTFSSVTPDASQTPTLGGTFYIGTRNGSGTSSIDSDVMWYATGTGTLSDADAAAINRQGNSDPNVPDLTTIDTASTPTFVWKADNTNYQDTNPSYRAALQLDDTYLFRSGAGALTLQNATDSPTAFQIQKADATPLLVVDSTNGQLAVGPSGVPANGVLTIGTNTTTAAGGIYFGTDTNLFRSAADTLKSDDSLVVAGASGVKTTVVAVQQVASAATLVFKSSVSGDSQDRFELQADGQLNWGSGSATLDTNLYRGVANGLRTDDQLQLSNSSTTCTAYATGGSEACIWFGSDTNLYRLAANSLKTDSALTSTGLITAAAGVSVAAGQSYTGAGAVTVSTGANGDLTLNPNGTGAIIATLDATTAITNGDLQINRSGTLTAADSTGDIIATRSVVTNSTGSLNDTANFVQLTSNITGTGTDTGSVLGVTQSNASASGAAIAISNSGSGNDIQGSSSNWTISKTGAATFAGTVAANGSGGITSTQATLIINAGGNVDVQDALNADNITTDTGGVSIAASQAYTGSGAVSVTTGSNGDLTLNPNGTGAIIATLDSVGAASGINDFQVNRSGSLTATDSTADVFLQRTIVTGAQTDSAAFLQVTSNINSTSGTDSGVVLGVTQSNASATGAAISISNSGSGVDILGTSSTWQVTKAGAATFVGVNYGSGTLQGSGTVTINTSGSNGTSIGTGTYIGALGLGNSSATATIAGSTSSTINFGSTFSTSSGGVVNASTGYQVAGAAASGNYLRGNGTNFVSSGIQASDIPSGSANYIQNQSSLQSSSNFHISGTGTADTSFSTPTVVTASGNLALQPATGVAVLNKASTANELQVYENAVSPANYISLKYASGGLVSTNSGDLLLQPASGIVSVNKASTANAIRVYENAVSPANYVSILYNTISTNSGDLTLQGAGTTYVGNGTGPITIDPGVGNNSAVTITARAASTWSSTAGALTITSNQAATWSTANGGLTINGAAASTVSTTTGNLTLTAGGANTVVAKPGTDSTTAFQVTQSGGSAILDVDSTNHRVGIGTAANGFSPNSPQDTLDVLGNLHIYNPQNSQGNIYSTLMGAELARIWGSSYDFNTTGTAFTSGLENPAAHGDLRAKNNFQQTDANGYVIDLAGDGADGAVTIPTGTQNINTTNFITGRTCSNADGGTGGDAPIYTSTVNTLANATSITLVQTPNSGGTSCLANGDEVLIIDMQGTSGANTNVGKYDVRTITSISTNVLNFATGLVNGYDGTTQKIMVVRIPNYTNVTVTGTMTANAWDGTKGGVLFFRANGTVTVNGSISASSLGYRAGAGAATSGGKAGESYDGNFGATSGGTTAGTPAGALAGGNSGNGTTAAPLDSATRGGGGGGGSSGSASASTTSGGGGGGGSYGGGASGGAGGGIATAAGGAGGTVGVTEGGSGGGGGGKASGTSGAGGAGGIGGATANATGGTGGSNGGSGGTGGADTTDTKNPTGNGGGGGATTTSAGGGGSGGGSYGKADLTVLFLGSGGGGGGSGATNSGTAGSGGGIGGGIVFVGANILTVSGTIVSGGANGATATTATGSGGGGAGGSILIKAVKATLGSGLVTASGGTGAASATDGAGGGNGGLGRIRVETRDLLSGTTTPTASTTTLANKYSTGDQTWTSETQDAGSGNTYRPNKLKVHWVNDTDGVATNNIRFQIQASDDGTFTGVHLFSYPGTSNYFTTTTPGVGDVSISDATELDVSSATTGNVTTSYRYWRVKALLNAGATTTDTPQVKTISLREYRPLILQQYADNVGIGNTAPTEKLSVGGNILIGAASNSSTDFELKSATAGQVSNSATATTAIDNISASAVFNGSLYVGTNESGKAEVYRYDGNGQWTQLNITGTAGKFNTTTAIDGVIAMTVWNGNLYIGTSKSNSAEVYRYDGGTTWSPVNSGCPGSCVAGKFQTTTGIDGVTAMTVNNGSLYIGTNEPDAAQIYRYDNGGSWTVLNGTAGTFITTTLVNKVSSMVSFQGLLYAGTSEANAAQIVRYDANGVFTAVQSGTSGTVCGQASSDTVSALLVFDGALYAGTTEAGLAQVCRYEYNLSGGTTWLSVVFASGTIVSGGTTGIDGVGAMTNYAGDMYIGTSEANSAEVYRYTNGGASWTKLSNTTAGTIPTTAAGTAPAATGIDTISTMTTWANIGNSLFVGTNEADKGEIYSYFNSDGLSYSIKFNGASDNANAEQNGNLNIGTIKFIAEDQTLNSGNDATGRFYFSHGINTSFGAYDVAEDYPTRDDSLQAGDLLSFDTRENQFVRKSTGAGDGNIMGVYSEKPGLRLSQDNSTINGGTAVPVALAGRVPLKVSTENGPIAIGDNLMASSTPGVAMKATKAGRIIGQAIESYSGDGVGKVMTYVSPGDYLGSVSASLPDASALNGLGGDELSAKILDELKQVQSAPNLSEIFTDRLVASQEIITPKITAGVLDVGSIKADHIEGLDVLVGRLSGLPSSQTSTATQPASSLPTDITQLKVDGSLSAQTLTLFSDLNVGGNLTVSRVSHLVGEVSFDSLVNFYGKAAFASSVSFDGHVLFGSDAGGQVVIKKGDSQVEVKFATPYDQVPLITANYIFNDSTNADGTADSAQAKQARLLNASYSYAVGNVNQKGFVLFLNKPAAEDMTLSWLATQVNNAKITISSGQ